MNIYQTNFLLLKVHGISLNDIDYWIPWEREVYVTLLASYIEERNKRLANQR